MVSSRTSSRLGVWRLARALDLAPDGLFVGATVEVYEPSGKHEACRAVLKDQGYPLGMGAGYALG